MPLRLWRGDIDRCATALSCGCLRRDLLRTHGQTGTPEYRTWLQMKMRCENPKTTGFLYYGGRGIRICERWEKFENFLADMGEKPSSRHSIDRIDNNGHYEPGNCRWATPKEQASNRRPVSRPSTGAVP